MVANTYKGCMYAYDHQIDETNIRELWDIIVKDVCENENFAGTLYRDGMVYIGNEIKTEHKPAKAEEIPQFMKKLYAFDRDFQLDPLIKSFVSPYRGRIQSLIGRCVKKKYAEMKPGDQAEA